MAQHGASQHATGMAVPAALWSCRQRAGATRVDSLAQCLPTSMASYARSPCPPVAQAPRSRMGGPGWEARRAGTTAARARAWRPTAWLILWCTPSGGWVRRVAKPRRRPPAVCPPPLRTLSHAHPTPRHIHPAARNEERREQEQGGSAASGGSASNDEGELQAGSGDGEAPLLVEGVLLRAPSEPLVGAIRTALNPCHAFASPGVRNVPINRHHGPLARQALHRAAPCRQAHACTVHAFAARLSPAQPPHTHPDPKI